MKIKLRRTWFYPVDAKPLNDLREISGGRLRKGIHEVDESLKPYFPKDVIILDESAGEEPVLTMDEPQTLADFDTDKADADAFAFALEEQNKAADADDAKAEEKKKAQRLENLAKAREAKKAKKQKAK